MSDNYEFMKASESQDIDDYSPYVDKQYNNYINDINNGVYTNNSLSLINYDLGQIYNSLKFVKTNFVNLIHQSDLQINGTTIESTQPFINVVRHSFTI